MSNSENTHKKTSLYVSSLFSDPEDFALAKRFGLDALTRFYYGIHVLDQALENASLARLALMFNRLNFPIVQVRALQASNATNEEFPTLPMSDTTPPTLAASA